MDTDQIKQAQEAWANKRKQLVSEYLASFEGVEFPHKSFQKNFDWAHSTGYSDGHIQGISDYKASLEKTFSDHLKDVRKEFDALTGEEETALEEEIELSARIDTIKWVLELLNTCKPTN